jgi:transcriptional regulator with XRE-family HTH domain
MKRFDARALYQALDEKRKSRGLSWREVATEIGVSVSTIKRTQSGGRMEVDGMLAMVAWLGVSVENFIHESD